VKYQEPNSTSKRPKSYPSAPPKHRERIVATRKINPLDQSTLNECIHIAKDGSMVCPLRAWIGNHIEKAAPWEPILDKIQKALNIWSKSHPTLMGRKLIIQATVGGLTQFLTKAQGMPKHIEQAITKIICNFMWRDDSSP
jgi:hypothetical protein